LTGKTIVAVPVKNEAERISACLLALANQNVVSPDAIVLVVNNTTDQTATIVRALAQSLPVSIEVIEHEFPPERASAGSARRMAMERAAALAGLEGAVLTTDADGQVPLDWVAANLYYLRRGLDAVAGRAVLDAADQATIPARLREDDALECAYAAALDEMASIIAPRPWDPWPRHTEHSGASIAVTVAAYGRAGGMPAAPVAEDRKFFAALEAVGARIRHAPEIAVTVSGRTVGRAEGGMADTIRRRLHRSDPYLDDALEPAMDRWRRLRGEVLGEQRLVPADAAAAELEAAQLILARLSLNQQIIA
jgi:glycosyltransferase involved in cell wall biosynthesis